MSTEQREEIPAPAEVLKGPTPAPQVSPQDRAAACYRQIEAALRAHGCRIVPMVQPEQVGTGPTSKLLLSTTWGVFPTEAL